MYKVKCRNDENCIYFIQGKCKFLHPKDISVFNENTLNDNNIRNPILYIRHAKKGYKNGENKEFSLDPDITEDGKIEAINKFILLVYKYGAPERIVTSPYLRTRMTAEIARSIIFEKTNLYVEIYNDNKLGECLKNQVGKDLNVCLRPETLIHNPIPPETLKEYNDRIYKHTKMTQRNTWYITHGFNIYTIASKYKIKYPNELCGIAIYNSGKIEII